MIQATEPMVNVVCEINKKFTELNDVINLSRFYDKAY